MPTRRLEVELIGDDRSLRRMLGRSGRSMSMLERRLGTTGRVADRVFTRMGSAARTATPYIVGGLAVGLGKAVAEAREAEKAGNQTRAVIKSMGSSANVTAKHVEELAESISIKAGMDDEAIQQGENLLLTFKNIRNEAGAGNQVFDRTTSIVTDMSVALGQDMKQSAIQLGKALNDPTIGLTALRRVGVSFTTQQTEQIQKLYESGDALTAQKLILQELEGEFKGSAAAQADALDRIKVAGANFAEEIGMRILPGLEALADKASDIISDPTLSEGEKMGKLADLFEDQIIAGIDKLDELAPRAAEAGGRIALRMAEGFAKSFVKSDWIGRIFLGGMLLRTLGGPGTFTGIGRTIGGFLGLGVAQGAAAGVAGGAAAGGAGRAAGGAVAAGGRGGGFLAGLVGSALFGGFGGGGNLTRMGERLGRTQIGGALGRGLATGLPAGLMGALSKVRWARVGGLGIGLALAESIFKGVQLNMDKGGEDLMKSIESRTKASLGGIALPVSVQEDGGLLKDLTGLDPFGTEKANKAKELQRLLEDMQKTEGGITAEQRRQVEQLSRQVGLTREQRTAVRDILNTEQLENSARRAGAILAGIFEPKSIAGNVARWNKQMRSVAGFTDDTMRDIERAFKQSPERGVNAMSKAFDRGVGNIRRSMRSGQVSTKKGLDMIEKLLLAQLELFGVDPKGPAALKRLGAADAAETHKESGVGPGLRLGGLAAKVPGTGPGDRHILSLNGEPIARVESQESVFVGNRTLTSELEQANAAIPRREDGGYAWGGGRPLRHFDQMGGPKKKSTRMPRWQANYFAAEGAAGGLNKTAALAEKMLERAAKKQRAGAIGSGKGNWGVMDALARKFGNTISSAHRPGDDGWHGVGIGGGRARATDYAGGQMLKFAQKVAARFGKNLLELIHTPMGFGIKNGARVPPYAAADHYDHVHVAMRKGGKVPMRGTRWVPGGDRKSPGGSLWTADEAATLLWQVGASPAVAGRLSAKVHGESGGRANAVGNDPGGTQGLGLWQITTGFNNDVIRRFGGRAAMFDPVQNAKAALAIYQRQGIGAWYAGSGRPGRILRNLVGPDASRGAISAAKKHGVNLEDVKGTGRRGKITRQDVHRHVGTAKGGGGGGGSAGGSTGSASAPGGGSVGGAGAGGGALPSLGDLGNLGDLTFEDQMSLLDAQEALADLTPGEGDDFAVIHSRLGLLGGRDAQVVRQIKRLNKRIKRAPKKKRRALKAKRSERISEHAQLVADQAALQAELQADEADRQLEIAEAQRQLAAEMKALREELERNRKIAESAMAMGLVEAQRALADMISGELGGFVGNQARTAGAGAAVSF